MFLLAMLLSGLGCVMTFELTPVYEWSHLEYRWTSECEEKLAIATGLYNYTKIVPYDAGWRKDGTWFVTTTRIDDVNPASLCTVFEEPGENGRALLQPYPSPEWHVVGNCSGITNVLKFVIDKCDNMWMVDSGKIGNEEICPAQILKFDMKTDQLILRHQIPKEVSKGGMFATNAVRTEGANCEKPMLFAADMRGSGFLIFDGSTSWRLDNDIFKPDTKLAKLTADDQTVEISFGPIGFLDVDKKYGPTAFAVMWSFSASHAYGLPFQDLIDSRDSQDNLQWYQSEFEFSSPATAGIISKEGILLIAFIGRPKLSCVWLGTTVTSKSIDELIDDSEPPQLITSMKSIIDDEGNEHVMFVKNDYIRFKAGITNFQKPNAGIYVVKMADLTNGTRCQPEENLRSVESWEANGFTPVEIHNGSVV